MRKMLILVVLIGILAGGAWWWRERDQTREQFKVLATATVTRGEVREVIEATGIIKFQVGAEIKIGAQASGRIEQMLVRIGQHVRKGELIAVIDDRELMAQQREFAAEQRKAQAQYEYARKDHSRQSQLRSKNTVEQDRLDKAEQQLATLQGELAVLEAVLDALEVRLSYTRIKSPIDGLVSQVTSQEGETVVSSMQASSLITIVDVTRLEMWIYADETDIGLVKPGQDVEFRVDAFPGETFRSTVREIYPKPEIRDNIVYYLALTPINAEQARNLRPEMTTHCSVVVQVRNDALVLPNTALKWVNGEQVVYVRRAGGEYDKIKPTLGLNGLESSEILDGLNEGDVVATQLVLPKGETGPAVGKPGTTQGQGAAPASDKGARSR